MIGTRLVRTDGGNDDREREVGDRAVSRRRLLASTGVTTAALAGCYDSGPGDAGSGGTGGSGRETTTEDTTTGNAGEATDAWEAKADARIRTYRTGGLDVVVSDGAGNPVPNAAVDVTMQRHAFGFGTAVDAEYLVERTTAGDEYRRRLGKLFNKAVLQNHHKWGFWEQPRARRYAEAATNWLLDRGLEVRGHTCIWQKRNEGAIPDDVVRAMEAGDGEHVRRRTHEHVEDIVAHYGDVPRFTEWDVLNEQVTEHGMTDVTNPEDPSTEANVLPEWYRTAKRADPDAQLYVNEYSILAGDDERHKDRFETVVRHLLEHDAPLDGIGVQAHHWDPEQRRTPAQLLATLDRFAELVPSIQVHEYDTWGDAWTERMEAEYLYEFLKTLYSHPAAEGFLMWGFWDDVHWHGNAPLFRRDWSRKPAYDVYVGLVFDEWWTDERGRTDADGRYATTGFLGDYEVSARADGVERTTTVRLDDPTAREVVTIELPTGGESR